MSQLFEIVVGTYEEYLLGYKVNCDGKVYELERSFATHSHIASVRSVCSEKYFLSSAGADDTINLYDMRYRMETGKLTHHNDTVNCIAFTPDASHLLSCSNDGTIAAVRCGNWQLEKHWLKPHKGLAVNTLAIHPSGKIALSVGADGILRTWNLIKGRQAYATNLATRLKFDAKHINVLKWSPNGEKYLLAVGQRIDLYSVHLAGISCELILDSKVICIEFLNDDLIAIGLESGQVKFYNVKKSVEVLSVTAHNVRIKCIAHKEDLLVTASSTGEIKLWRYTKNSLDILQSTNCGTRITCLTLVLSNNIQVHKEKKLEFEEKEQNTVRPESKLKHKQEVTIEYEDKWERTDMNSVSTQSVNAMRDKGVSDKKERKVGRKDSENSVVNEGRKRKKQKKKFKDKNSEQHDEITTSPGADRKKSLKSDAQHVSVESNISGTELAWAVEDNHVPPKKKRKKTVKNK